MAVCSTRYSFSHSIVSKRCFSMLLFIMYLPLIWGCEELIDGEEIKHNQSYSEFFGLPGKGDQNCDIKSILCWSQIETQAIQTLMDVEADYLLGEVKWHVVDQSIQALAHKLTAEQQQNRSQLLRQEGQNIYNNQEEGYRTSQVQQALESVYGDIIAGYWSAYASVITPALASQSSSPRSCCNESKTDFDQSLELPNSLSIPEVFKPALTSLWQEGPMGQYLVFMIAMTGSLRELPSTIPLEFRTVAQDKGLDEKGFQIIQRYARYSALESSFANLQSLIPVAGVFLAVPYNMYAQFKQRLRMTLALCAHYGLDIHQPDILLTALSIFVGAQGIRELLGSTLKVLLGQQTYSVFAENSPDLLPNEFSQARIRELSSLMLSTIGILGTKLLNHLSAQAAKSAGKSVLNQITFGLAAIADVTVNYFMTANIGKEVLYTIHPWGWGLWLEEARILSQNEYRQCALDTLTVMIQADQVVTLSEIEFLIRSLLRPHRVDQSTSSNFVKVSYEIIQNENTPYWAIPNTIDDLKYYIDHASLATKSSVISCIDQTWNKASIIEQLSWIAWIQSIAYQDASFSPQEQALFNELIAQLKSSTEYVSHIELIQNRIELTYMLDPVSFDRLWYTDYDEMVNLEIWDEDLVTYALHSLSL